MNNKFVYALCISMCTLLATPLFGQQDKVIKISGYLVDSLTTEPLIGATIVLLQPEDSVMVAFSITNADGEFALRRVKPDTYLVQTSYVGYKGLSYEFTIPQVTEDFDMGVVYMNAESEILEGATIVDERIPVRMSKDTIIYNADAFKQQPNDNVEDLLKRMPGIEVDGEGNITAEGEEVQQVLVDGKEFFGSDPKMATKNLPARAIKEVQVFDKKSEVAEFSGIDDGIRSKTINLKLKDDYKKGIFGNATAGYGTDDRYNGKFNLNSFNKNTQLSTIGQLNNINEQGFSMGEYVNFMGGLSNLMRGGGRVRVNNNSAIPISNGQGDGDTDTGGIGLNLNHSFSKKTKLNATYFYSDVKNETLESSRRDYFQSVGEFTEFDDEQTNTHNKNHKVSLRFDHEIDSTQSLRMRASGNFTDSRYDLIGSGHAITSESVLQNESTVQNQATSQVKNIDTDLIYRKKFRKPGRSVVGEAEFEYSPSDQDALLQSVNTYYRGTAITIDSIHQRQDETSDVTRYGASVTWTEPINKSNYLGISYDYDRNQNESDKDVFDISPEMEEIINTQLSVDYQQVTQFHRGEVAWRWIQDKSNLNISLAGQKSILDGSTSTFEIYKDYFHVLPGLQWNYDFSRSKGISVNYTTNIQMPTLNQLQPIIDNSDPQNIYIGNPGLDPEYRHNITLRYKNFSQFSGTSLFGNVRFTYTENEITNSSTVDSNLVRLITPVNIDHSYNTRAWINFGTPLRFINSRLNARATVNYNNGFTLINLEETGTDRWTNTYSVSLENTKKEWLDWRVGVDFTHSKTTYSGSDQSDQGYTNQTYWFDLTGTWGSWSVFTGLDANIYQDNQSSEVNSIPILRASVSKYILSQRGEIKLSAYDLLDENRGYSQNIDLNYIEEISTNSLGRYFMLSFIYTIGTFQGNAFQHTGPGSSRRR